MRLRRIDLGWFLVVVLVIAGVVSDVGSARAADAWVDLPNMPTSREGAVAAAGGGLIYVIGGSHAPVSLNDGRTMVNVVEAYDPTTGSWTCSVGDTGTGCTESNSTLVPMPTARTSASAAVVNGKIYVIGGRSDTGLSIIEAYDPSTNSWTCSTNDSASIGCASKTLAPMPTARWYAAAVPVNGLIYVLGGTGDSFAQTNVVEVYDPADNSWSTSTPLPTARWGLAAAAIGDVIYTMGGTSFVFQQGSTYYSLVEAYDVGGNSWACSTNDFASGCGTRTLAPLPAMRAAFPAVSVGGLIYTIDGYGPACEGCTVGYHNDLFIYDPVANGWSNGAGYPHNILNNVAATAAPDGTIYAFGGSHWFTDPTFSQAEAYYTTSITIDAPSVVGPNGPFSITVTVRDNGGNPLTDYTGTVRFTTSDTGTGVSLPADYTFTTGAGGDNGVHTFSGVQLVTVGNQTITATDTVAAGFTGQTSITVDATAPTVNATATKADSTAYSFGSWSNQAVTVSLSATDAQGIQSIGYQLDQQTAVTIDGIGPVSVQVSADGQHTLAFWATDTLNNTSPSQTVNVNIDTVAPTVTASATAGGAAYDLTAPSWTNQDVAVTAQASDNQGGSGIASISYTLDGGSAQPYTGPITIASEGQHTLIFTTTDLAGNLSASFTAGVWIDKSGPNITISSPIETTYTLNQVVYADYSCTDRLSGIDPANCVGTVPNETPIDTSTIGQHEFSVTAIDNVGNRSPGLVTYTVGYGLDLLYDPAAGVRHGLWAWIKLEVADANGVNLSSRLLEVQALNLAPAEQPWDGQDPNLVRPFQYSRSLAPGGGGYQLLINTSSLARGTYVLSFTIGNDPTLHTASFTVI